MTTTHFADLSVSVLSLSLCLSVCLLFVFVVYQGLAVRQVQIAVTLLTVLGVVLWSVPDCSPTEPDWCSGYLSHSAGLCNHT